MSPPEESLKSKMIGVFVPTFFAVTVGLASIVADFSCDSRNLTNGEVAYWFQRSGAFISIMGAIIAFHEAKQSRQFIDGIYYVNDELPYKKLAFFLLVFGTFVWGYGDIPVKALA